MVKHAIILAGGKGERLRPYTEDRPKVMVEVAGKPILLWQIEWLKSHGITKFILTVSYKYEVVQQYFGDGSKFGIEIDYSIEDNPLGRGGAIKKAFQSELLKDVENVFIANGDEVFPELEISQLVKWHEDNHALVSLVIVPYVSRWGIVKLDDDHVVGFDEKPKLPYWINGGIYIFNRDVEPLLPETGDHETETFPKIEKDRFLAFKYDGFWRAVDVVKDRSEAEEFLEKGREDFS